MFRNIKFSLLDDKNVGALVKLAIEPVPNVKVAKN